MRRTTRRTVRLRRNLIEHRRQLVGEVHTRVRDRRGSRPPEGSDDLELSEADSQEDLAFALLQIRVEAVALIDAALRRLDAGHYGSCAECEEEISERRLQAVPFAVRCQPCEQERERVPPTARQTVPTRGIGATSPSPTGF
jgi:RNA polymerase-binding transcription factor